MAFPTTSNRVTILLVDDVDEELHSTAATAVLPSNGTSESLSSRLGDLESTTGRSVTMPTTRANSFNTVPDHILEGDASNEAVKNPFDAVFCDLNVEPPAVGLPTNTPHEAESLCKVPSCSDVQETVIHILTYAAPAIGTQLGIYLIIMTSLGFVGNLLDVADISGFAFACLINDVCVYAVASGFSAATDTLCSQMYGKNPESPMLVVYVVRSTFVSLLVSIVLSVTAAVGLEDLMLLLAQPSDVAAASGVVMRILLAAVIPSVLFECLIRYLQAKAQQVAPSACMLSACATHPLTTWLMTTHFGLEGAAWAFVISNTLATVFLIAYMVATADPLFRRWRGPRKPVFEAGGMWRTIKLGVPGFITTVSELAVFDYCTIVAGWLGVTDQAAQTIVFSIEELVFMIPFGLGTAASALVGNKVGEGDSIGAKRLSIAFVIVTAVISCTVGTLMMTLRNQLPAIFTADAAVQQAAASSLLVAGPFQLPDGFVGVALGIARAVGAQVYGNWSFLLVFYPITLTLSTVLPIYTILRGQGIWVGLLCGQFATGLVMVYAVTQKADWTTYVDDDVVTDDDDDDHPELHHDSAQHHQEPATLQIEVLPGSA